MKHTYCSLVVLQLLSVFTYTAAAQILVLDSVITTQKLREVVYQLADDSLEGRHTGSLGCDKAAVIIANRMQAAGVRKIKGLNGYFQHLDIADQPITNVVGVSPGSGKPNEIVLISAHYDHIGKADAFTSKFSVDDINNGANDNASGVAVMLSLAEWFSHRSHQRTILFAAFSGEEIGMYGSRGFSYTFYPDSIVAQINLEMLGRRDVYKRPFITGYSLTNLRDILNDGLRNSAHPEEYFETDKWDKTNLFMRSDNYPLALKGVPAHTIMLSTDADPFYHTVKDEARTLDYEGMCIIARNIAKALESLIQARATPRRIRPGTIPATR